MKALYVTIKKLIKARQLSTVEQIKDLNTGESFIGQPGDWHVEDQNGHVFIMTYHQFNQRYTPYNYEAFCDFSRRKDNYNKRGKSLIDIKYKIKQNIKQS